MTTVTTVPTVTTWYKIRNTLGIMFKFMAWFFSFFHQLKSFYLPFCADYMSKTCKEFIYRNRTLHCNALLSLANMQFTAAAAASAATPSICLTKAYEKCEHFHWQFYVGTLCLCPLSLHTCNRRPYRVFSSMKS